MKMNNALNPGHLFPVCADIEWTRAEAVQKPWCKRKCATIGISCRERNGCNGELHSDQTNRGED